MVFFRKIIASAIFSGVVLSGCATSRMDVTVDIMDPEHARTIIRKAENSRFMRQSLMGDKTHMKRELTHICSTFFEGRKEVYEASVKQLRDVKAKKPDYPSIDLMIKAETEAMQESEQSKHAVLRTLDFTDCEKQIDHGLGWKPTAEPERYNRLVVRHEAITCENEEGCSNADPSMNIDLYLRGLQSFRRNANLALENFVITQSENAQVRAKAAGLPDIQAQLNRIASLAKNNLARPVTNANNSYLGRDGRTLVLTDVAYESAKAGKDKWVKDYNVARGIGVGGSTDTVIKLNNTADFSVKGLVFDARSTALTARKLTISSLQLLASGAGIPIRAPGDPQADGTVTGTDTLDGNDQIVQAKVDILADEEKRASYRGDLRRVALSTLYTAEKIKKLKDGGALVGAATTQAKDLRGKNADIVEITFGEPN